MKIFEYTFKMNGRWDEIRLRPFFDCHIGSANCDIKQLKEDIAEVKRLKNCYAILGGDVVEAINISDKRFELHGLQDKFKAVLNNLVREQTKEAIKLFEPIKDRLLFLLEGNHELKCKQTYCFDPSEEIAEGLNIPNMGYSCFARFSFLRSSEKRGSSSRIDIYAHHGIGGGNTSGAKINALHKLALGKNADIYLAGHSHGLIADSVPVLGLGNHGRGGKISLKSRNKLYVLCGTYNKTYMIGNSGYGERAGYSPAHIGSPIIKIKPFPQYWDKENKCTKEDSPLYVVEDLGAK